MLFSKVLKPEPALRFPFTNNNDFSDLYANLHLKNIKKHANSRQWDVYIVDSLRHTEVKGGWFFKWSIDLILFPQPLLPDSPLDLLETPKAARAVSCSFLWIFECKWPFEELIRNPTLKWGGGKKKNNHQNTQFWLLPNSSASPT